MKTNNSKTQLLTKNTQYLLLNSLFFLLLIHSENHLITKINNNLSVSASKIKSSIEIQNNKKSFYTSNLNNRFTEDCDNFLTCEACLKNSEECGWCYTDGLCKSGNTIGASTAYNFCPFDAWTTKKCRAQQCKNYQKQLACITDENCFWCENSLKVSNGNNKRFINGGDNNDEFAEGTCEDKEIKYSKLCNNKYDIDDYFKNPKFFRNKKTNIIISNKEQNKKLPKLDMNKNLIKKNNITNEDIEGNQANNINNRISKYEDYQSNLKSFKEWNVSKTPPFYDSILNPAGIFTYQRQLISKNFERPLSKTNKPSGYKTEIGPIKSLNMTLRKMDSAYSDTLLLQDTRKEIHSFSKKIAVDGLIKMFVFWESEPHIMKSEIKFNLMEYKILEKLAEEKWIEFLAKKKIKINDVRVLIGFYREDRTAEEDVNKIVEKHQKISHFHPFKINDEEIDALHNFKTDKWSTIPGASMGFHSYFDSILIVFQKIRLEGKGSRFESIAVSNEEGIKSLMNFRHKKKLSKIDLNNFVARKVIKGDNKFYLAYKSNFQIALSDENTILNYALELPFTNNLQIFHERFNPVIPNELLPKTIFKYDLKVILPESELEEHLLRQNYLFIYKLSSNYLEKNSFVKLNIKHRNNNKTSKKTFVSCFVHLPFYSEIKNIMGIAAMKMPKGNFEISADFKYIFIESILDKDKELNNTNYIKKFGVNYFPYKNKLGKEINFLNSSLIKNGTIPKQDNDAKEAEKPVTAKVLDNPEAAEHLINDGKEENNKKNKKRHKKKKHYNDTEYNDMFLRDGEEYKEDFSEEDSVDDLELEEKNPELNIEEEDIKNQRVNGSIHNNKTKILFNKKRHQGMGLSKNTTRPVEEKIDSLRLEKFDNEFLLEKIKELSLRLEKSEQETNKNFKYSKSIEADQHNNIKTNSRNLLYEINFIQNNQARIESENNNGKEIEEEEEDDEDDDDDEENETDNRFLDKTNENANKTKTNKKHKKKHKHHKKNNSTSFSNVTKLAENATKYNSSDSLNKTFNSEKDLSLNKSSAISNLTVESHSQPTNQTANVSTIGVHKKRSKKHKGKHHHGKKHHHNEEPMKNETSTNATNQNKTGNQQEAFSNVTANPKANETLTNNDNMMKNLHQVLKNVNNETEDPHQHVKNEFFELDVIKLPLSTIIYNKVYKKILYFQANNELNEVPSLAFDFKLSEEKNVLMYFNAIMTLDYIADFEFRLHINRKDECNSAISSKSKQIVNENSIHVKTLPAGEYKIEVLYNTNKQGDVDLGKNEWDVLSLTVVAFDI